MLDREISDQPISFLTTEAAAANPLATRLMAIPGVTNLLFLGDFVTINKSPEARWADINGRVRKVLAGGDGNGAPVAREEQPAPLTRTKSRGPKK